MEWIDFVRTAHVLGACVLIGTGSGIAFFMLMANRTGDPTSIAHTSSIVVVADMLFTATAAVAQPITGLVLAWNVGWAMTEGWLALSLGLYVLIGVFWLPVVVIQTKMRDEALAAVAADRPLSNRYRSLYRIWFACGFPAFAAVLAILWLMLMKPAF